MAPIVTAEEKEDCFENDNEPVLADAWREDQDLIADLLSDDEKNPSLKTADQIAIKLVFVVKDKWGNVCCYVVCPTRALSFNEEPMHIIMMQGEPIGHTDLN